MVRIVSLNDFRDSFCLKNKCCWHYFITNHNHHLHFLYTLNDFDVISSFCDLNDLSSITGLGGCTELQFLISLKSLNPSYLSSQ